jgi:hypothetical protein
MGSHKLVLDWFGKWEKRDYYNLPIIDDFSHTSPYGTITGKEAYLNMVESNEDKFLGYRFVLHDILAEEN